MSATYVATPPTMASCNNNYKDWKRLIKHWQNLCGLDKNQKASAIMLTLSGKALNAALQLPEMALQHENGVDTLLTRLDTLYLKDELSDKFSILENYEIYKRPPTMSIRDFLHEFDARYHKVKEYGINIPDDLLGFRLIRAANLSSDKQELVKATVSELKYEDVKSKLKQIFSDDSKIPSTSTSSFESTTSLPQETFQASSSETAYDSSEAVSNSDEEETFYANRFQKHRKRVSFSNNFQHRASSDRSSNYRPSSDRSSSNKNWRSRDKSPDQRSFTKNTRSFSDRYNRQRRCDHCESINHWANQCPDRPDQDKDTYLVHEITLHAIHRDLDNRIQSDSPVQMETLIGETWGAGLLDCGASRTVNGSQWLEEYINALPAKDKSAVSYFANSTFYRFGDGVRVESKKSARIPAYVGSKKVFINTDIVEKDIPLLLSKAFMKNANMILDFRYDTVDINGEIVPLQTTHSGHYILPLLPKVQLIHNLTDSDRITLTLKNDLSDTEIARKLHRQFAHPSREKLHQLIKLAGDEWNSNKGLLTAIDNITSACQVCQKFQKTPPRPIVGLPMATQFLETVAIDIKFYGSKPILHLIDLCTRLSAASVMPNKQPETVIRTILRIWISVYGATEKFLVDNGGEFANDTFINMAEKFGISVKTTAGYSPWSNGTIERHNQTLGNQIDKVLSDTSCDLETAVPWCVSAKNSLHNVNGFTPFQLSIGTNPKLPSTLTDKIPALTTPVTSKTLSEHLQAIHKAREAFIQCENSERIRRALSHNVRSSGDIKYLTGDSVYYKRDSSSAWHGPGKVLGQDGQQVLIKHGSYYVRAHPCRVRLERQPLSPSPSEKSASHQQSSSGEEVEIQESKQPLMPVILSKHCSKTSSSPITEQLETSFARETDIDNSQSLATPSVISIDSECSTSKSLPQELPSVQTTLDISPSDNMPSINEGTSAQNLNDDLLSSIPPVAPALKVARSAETVPLKLQPGLNVKFVNEKGESIKSLIDTRAGKVNGRYPHWWNTTRLDGKKEAIDFSKVTSLELDTTANTTEDVFLTNTKEAVRNAKSHELDQWKEQSVYTEVTPNNQDTISLRWVCTPKIINGIPSIKARLVAKGFQEQQYVRGDSPTCSREGVKICLSIIASKSWTLRSLDISTAFLQGGPINREIYVVPPREAQTDKIWKLRKSVYGLNDASRQWYLRLREELINLGATPIKLDQGIFCWYDNSNLVGVMVCFVDDILYGGNSSFSDVISSLKDKFKVGSEHANKFEYIGINIKQFNNSIVISQNDYVNNLEPISLTSVNTSNPNRPLVDIELTILRGALGQLNWLSCITRPEISFIVSEISSRISSATVSDILSVNKTIKFVKSSPGFITMPKLDLSSLRITAYSDSSFNNLPKGNSQGAHVVFLADDNNQSCPVSWSSNKVKRVVRSTLAAETLAFTEAADTAFFIRKLIMEILMIKSETEVAIVCLTDSQSLFETIGTSHQTSDRRLRVEVSAIREMVDREEISVMWVKKDQQLSDVLTKKGASPNPLMSVLQQGSLL